MRRNTPIENSTAPIESPPITSYTKGMSAAPDLANIPMPRHIAVIMDGNGRWAVQRGLPRVKGHQEGAKTVRNIVTECARLHKEHGGPDFLTLYSFSLENWKRPSTKFRSSCRCTSNISARNERR